MGNNNNLSIDEQEALNDHCMTNLKILSSIKVGNKLSYEKTTKVFVIDEWTYKQPFVRYYYNESRKATVKHLEEFVSEVFSAIDAVYSSEVSEPYNNVQNTYYTDVTKSKSVFKEENSTLLLSYVSEIQNCISGSNNLKQTYKEDITTCSSIEIIVEKLNVRVKKIQNILSVKLDTTKNTKQKESN